MIEVKNVTKSFDGFRALDGLNITVPRGAVYGLVGPNGAGKSTVIRHLAGIYRQDAGEVLVDGAPVFDNPAVKSRIAYIPDDIFYYTQATNITITTTELSNALHGPQSPRRSMPCSRRRSA